METILTIAKNTNCLIQLIPCDSIETAIEKMKELYEQKCNEVNYDYYNTFLDEEMRYAQIVNDFEQTEFRIGTLS